MIDSASLRVGADILNESFFHPNCNNPFNQSLMLPVSIHYHKNIEYYNLTLYFLQRKPLYLLQTLQEYYHY